MKINEDCIRDVLGYLVDNLDIEQHFTNFYFKKISIETIVNDLKYKYDAKDIWYSIYNLHEGMYIESTDIPYKDNTQQAFNIYVYNVTFRGHQFYNAIQPETIWNKTKSVIEKVGVHTLNFIETTAHDVAVEMGTQAVKSVLGDNS